MKKTLLVLNVAFCTFLSASADIFEPMTYPAGPILEDILSREVVHPLNLSGYPRGVVETSTRRRGSGVESPIYMVDWSYNNSTATTSRRGSNDIPEGYRLVRRYITDEAWCLPGTTRPDEAIRQLCASNGVTPRLWARCCYGDEWGDRQLLRAVAERAMAQYFEPPQTILAAAHWCPTGMVVKQPASPREYFSTGEGRTVPPCGNADAVPALGLMLTGVTNGTIKSLIEASRFPSRSLAMRPEHIARCQTLDAEPRSYAVPLVGVAIHRPMDYAHEFAHFFNPVPANATTEWREFCAAYHAVKVHAWSLGIDLGTPGGWAEYWSQVGSAMAISALSSYGNISADGIALLTQYLESSPGDDVRVWCEDPSIGRRIL